MKHRVQS